MNRKDFLERLAAGRREWEAALERIPEARMTEPALAGGWSAKDVVAHVCWSERETAGVLRQRALVGSDLWALEQDARNAIVQAQNRDRPLAEVLADEREAWAALRPGLEALTDEELTDRSTFDRMDRVPADVLPWRIFAGSTFLHWEEHARDLRGLAPTA